MKRLIAILGCLVVSLTAFAQLNVQAEHAKLERLGSLRSTYAYLNARGTTYFLSIRTTNQFDDGTRFVLGKNAESAIQTLKDLIDAANVMDVDAVLEVMDADGEQAVLVKKKMIGKPYLLIQMAGQAGSSNITPAELEKAIGLIKEHAQIEE